MFSESNLSEAKVESFCSGTRKKIDHFISRKNFELVNYYIDSLEIFKAITVSESVSKAIQDIKTKHNQQIEGRANSHLNKLYEKLTDLTVNDNDLTNCEKSLKEIVKEQ